MWKPVGIAIILGLAVGGCTRSAPQLPPESTGAERLTALEAKQTCDDIQDEIRSIANSAKKYGAAIKAERVNNQIAGYFSAFFILPILATKHNIDEKRQLDALQSRWDRLIDVTRVKRCPFDADLTFRGR